MKKIILLLFCFSILTPAIASAQDIHKTRVTEDEDSVDTDVKQVANKKKGTKNSVMAGIELGLNVSVFTGGEASDLSFVFGWRLGTCVYVPIVGKFCMQPGIYYTSGTTEFHSHLRMADMPIHFGFRYGNKRNKLMSFIGLGPFAGYNFDVEYMNIRHWDYGLGLTSTTEWKSGFFMRSRVQAGLANLAQENGYANRSSLNYGIQLGYLLGKKKKPVMKHPSENYIHEMN